MNSVLYNFVNDKTDDLHMPVCSSRLNEESDQHLERQSRALSDWLVLTSPRPPSHNTDLSCYGNVLLVFRCLLKQSQRPPPAACLFPEDFFSV